MLRAVASLVAPPLCALCGRPCDYPDSLCRHCERKVAALRPSRSTLPGGLEVISAAPYEGIARELVGKMKFAARLTLAEVAAERMLRAWGATRGGGWSRFRRRRPASGRAAMTLPTSSGGWSPVGIWAQLAPIIEREDGPRQVGRPREERLADPPRVGLLSDKGDGLPSDDLWLVDDVVTTGATLTACAAVLKQAGAKRVRALTFAHRTPPHRLGPRARAA